MHRNYIIPVQISEYNEQFSEYVKQMLDVMEYDTPYTNTALIEKLSLKSKKSFRRNYLYPAIELNLINSRNQRYVKVYLFILPKTQGRGKDSTLPDIFCYIDVSSPLCRRESSHSVRTK